MDSTSVSEEIVVVTGGGGFLGQHIVKQLMEQECFPVKEIRVFDIIPFSWIYGIKGTTNDNACLIHYQGDICNKADLEKAFAGATMVVHNASVVDTSANPDAKLLHRVNVLGTKTVLDVCVQSNVKFLLYTSSIAVGSKSTYGTFKQHAEEIILKANSSKLNNGGTLRTCALRPVSMFGPGDRAFILGSFRCIRRNTFIRLGDNSPRYQCAYAGNIAWAFICALNRMRTLDGNTSPLGRAIAVADDTQVTSFTKFVSPYVEEVAKAKVSRFYIPFWALYACATVCEWLCYLCRPFYSFNLPLSRLAVISMCGLPIVDPMEAYRYIKYKPKYTYADVYPTCLQFYSYLQLRKTVGC